MASLSATELSLYALVSMLSMASAAVFVGSHQFLVGGDKGWTKPTGNDTQSYNFWASENRFQVGDTLYFKYKNDSVLVVNYTDYRDCIVSNPISKFENGSSAVIELDRDGVFYFISGQPGHCKAGQKLVVRVMGQQENSPENAPAMSPEVAGDGSEGYNWGAPSLNSTVKTALASYFVTALGGFFIVLYLFT